MSLDAQVIVDRNVALINPFATFAIAQEVVTERGNQDDKWGQQNHPDGTGGDAAQREADVARALCEHNFKYGKGTWKDILYEEVKEAFAESDPAKLREELLQVAAVASAWAEAIDRRGPQVDIDWTELGALS